MTITVELPQALIEPTRAKRRPRGVKLIAYGSYPCDWAGGRPFLCKEKDFVYSPESQHLYTGEVSSRAVQNETMIHLNMVRQELASARVPFYAAMTNILPDPSDDTEEVFGFLDELAEGEGNGVIVAHPQIHRTIRDRYGSNLKYISSVVRYALEPDVSLQELFDEFDHVVLRPETIKDNPESIPLEWRERSIIIVNYNCLPDCPKFLEHQQGISAKNKKGGTPQAGPKIDCPGYTTKLLLRPGEIKRLAGEGFTTFKVGRFEAMDDYARFVFPSLGPVLRKRRDLPRVETPDGPMLIVG